MANTVREFVAESLRGFYQRLPLKKIAVNGVEQTPDSSGVVNIIAGGSSVWDSSDNGAVWVNTGGYCSATGIYSLAEGGDTIASGPYSHAEGYDATASGNGSHAEGHTTTASGNGSHAEGTVTKASGNYSHAEGESTIAEIDAVAAHVEGYHTIAKNRSEHAEGEFNISHVVDNGENYTLYSIGNGTDASNRRNILEVLFDGSVYIRDIGGYDGSNYMDASTLQEVINAASSGDVADLMTNVTYTDLKNLRDTSALVPGMQYRITDYECTTTQPETQAASNLFDIIVTADSSTVLNENARACHHTGDTYFQNCKLEAWELKYSLDNDASTYYWADTSNGKGVVYYMKDEWNNECPYDFKNIKFKRYAITAYTETPSLVVDNSDNTYGFYYGAKEFWEEDGVVEIYNTIETATYDDNTYGYFYTFALKNLDNGNWYDFSVESSSELINTYGERVLCYSNCIKPALYNKLLLNGNIMYSIFSSNNTYTNCCYINAQGCLFCTCGAGSYEWTCGCDSYSWTCGNQCRDWSCGNNSGYWTCGNNCQSWTCGNGCYNWTCGDNCYEWSCGENCYEWSCGENCERWSCGNECVAWSCGNNCNSWVCENTCSFWSCGDGCYGWTCNSGSYCWTCGNNMHYFQILNGVYGPSSDNKLQLNFTPNIFYTQIAGKNSNGALKIWTPADLID